MKNTNVRSKKPKQGLNNIKTELSHNNIEPSREREGSCNKNYYKCESSELVRNTNNKSMPDLSVIIQSSVTVSLQAQRPLSNNNNSHCSSQTSDNDSLHERSTMSMSASSELSCSQPSSDNDSCLTTSSDSIRTSIANVKMTNSQSSVDPLEISRFPLRNPSEVNLGKIEEVRLVQKLLKEIKFIQSFDEDVLRGQKRYWLYTHNIVDETLRTRIKTALETHCLAHMQWITSCEFEINIDPDCKIEKVREYKKT